MKKGIFILLAIFSFSIAGMSQGENPKDPKAKVILDKVSKTNKSFSTIYIGFTYRLENKQNDIDETQSGQVWIKGDKYKLIFPGLERYSDGKTLWTFLEDDDECQVANAVDPDDDEAINPSSLLTIYESGFNYTYGETTTIDGKKADMIKLFPEGGGKPYHTLKIYVDQASSQIVKIEIFGKDGNKFTYNLNTIKSNHPFADSMFVFDTSKAGDVVDMRD